MAFASLETMELLADRRIELDARPTPALIPVLETVFIGHCPPDHLVANWARLGAALDEIGGLGFRPQAERLRAWAAGESAPTDSDEDATLAGLFNLPIPLYSLGQFQDLFPGVFDSPAAYASRLAGDRAWLPLAVQDYFEQSEPLPDGAKKLWIIRVPECAGRSAFLPNLLPDPNADLLDIDRLGAFERALLIPRAGILALPDLERLQIPADLPDIPRVRLDNPRPEFLPCATALDDTHRERRHRDEMPDPEGIFAPRRVVPRIARALARLRPDMQCLMALPFDAGHGSESPRPSLDFLAHLDEIVDPAGVNTGINAELADKLRHIQFLYPYLRGPDRQLGSPSGLIAGMQAEVSQLRGPWRSAAGRPLPGRSLPYPAVSQQLATALRDTPGVGVLVNRKGHGELDDERLAVPTLPSRLLGHLTPSRSRAEHLRSGETMRFLGWLRRELQALGEQLVFSVDPRDPRPGMLLGDFLDRLHRLGALRGRLPEQAYRLAQRQEGESTLVFDIEIAPAYPIDRIRLTFVHDRHAGGARVEMLNA
jgi:hypothetical protein